MKIVLAVTNSFCANFIKGQASFLKNEGHEVVIISSDGIEIKNLIKLEKATFYDVSFSKDISLINDLKSLFRVMKIIIQEKPDIINAGNPKPGFIFSLLKIVFYKIPFIFTLRGLRSDTLLGAKKRIVRFTEWFSCKMANKVIVISPSLCEYTVDGGILGLDKGVVIGKGSSNGIDIDYYSKTKEHIIKGDLLKKELKIKDEFIFLFVGRMTKDKGLEELVRVFDTKFSNNNNAILMLAGPIEEEDPLSQDILSVIDVNPRIHYVGKVLDPRPLYAISSCLVLLSYREGFGNVVIEAASMKIPSIVSNIPGLKDTVVDNETGLLVRPKDVNDIFLKMNYYYQNSESRRKHGLTARERIHSHFQSNLIWKGQLALYTKVRENR